MKKKTSTLHVRSQAGFPPIPHLVTDERFINLFFFLVADTRLRLPRINNLERVARHFANLAFFRPLFESCIVAVIVVAYSSSTRWSRFLE